MAMTFANLREQISEIKVPLPGLPAYKALVLPAFFYLFF